jgi:hypothetical protein
MAKSALAVRLQQETVAAMKAKDKERLSVLRMLQAAVKQVEVDTRTELDDQEIVKIVRSYAKKVRDALAGARSGSREDLASQAEAELKVVEEFLPAELDDVAIEAHVRAAVDELGATSPQQMGQVMRAAMARVAGQAEGGRVSAIVKKVLAG